MKNFLPCLFLICAFVSCDPKGKTESTKPASYSFDSVQVETLKASEPTNENLSAMISKKTDIDQKAMDTIITSLEKHSASFCDFITNIEHFEDSLYAIAKRKYPSPADQNAYSEYVSQLITMHEPSFLKSYGLTTKQMQYSVFIYHSDPDFKNFCSSK